MKKLFSLIICCVLILSSFSLYVFAAGSNPQVTLIKKDVINGTATVNIFDADSETIKIYKEVNGNTSAVTSYTSTGTAFEIKVSFPELSCANETSVIVYAIDSSGNKSNSASFNINGPHASGDWVTTKAATCSTEGSALRKCSKCEKTLETKSLPATGHSWNEPSWEWNSDYTVATATFKCKKDNTHSYTVKDSAVKVLKTVTATCLETGSKTYSATVTFSGKTYTTTKTISINKLAHTPSDWITQTAPTCTKAGIKIKKCTSCGSQLDADNIAPLGHDYEVTYTWSADKKTCTARAVCKRDSSHVETEIATGIDKITKEATCQSLGQMTRTAQFKNSIFSNQVKTAKIAGSHIDVNGDNICDVCKNKISISSESTTTATTSKSLSDSLPDSPSTTVPSTSTNQNPAEPTTQIIFDEPTTTAEYTEPSTSKNNELNPDENTSNKKTSAKTIIGALVALVIGIAGFVVALIFFKKDKKNNY